MKKKLERDVKRIFRILAEGQKKPDRQNLKRFARQLAKRNLQVADVK